MYISICEEDVVQVSQIYGFRYLGKETDEARAQEYITKINEKLDGYEAILSKQKYLAGDVSAASQSRHRDHVSTPLRQEITMADLFHLPLGVVAKKFSSESFSTRLHVAK
jgi:glutathione S-transferase